MNEQRIDFQPPVDLPKPQQESAGGAAENAQNQLKKTEAAQSQAIEYGQSAGQVPQISDEPPMQATQPAAQPVADPALDVTQGGAAQPLIADDVDLIEKEWVVKAKQIVEQTKNDPYTQNKQMNAVKAEYLKKRYNKDLKLTEE